MEFPRKRTYVVFRVPPYTATAAVRFSWVLLLMNEQQPYRPNRNSALFQVGGRYNAQ